MQSPVPLSSPGPSVGTGVGSSTGADVGSSTGADVGSSTGGAVTSSEGGARVGSSVVGTELGTGVGASTGAGVDGVGTSPAGRWYPQEEGLGRRGKENACFVVSSISVIMVCRARFDRACL